MILVDANILLRIIQIGHPHQQPAIDAIALLRQRDHEEFVTCLQVLYEMYVVCTRPVDAPYAGLGLAPEVAIAQVETAERQFPSEVESAAAIFSYWKSLVVKYSVIGKSTHDARLSAMMIQRKIPKILTFNDSHFARYSEVTAMNPFDVLGLPRS